MLPLTLLNAAKGRAMVRVGVWACGRAAVARLWPPLTRLPPPPAQLVELKSGETFNGTLDLCDNFMNLTLRDVYQTSSVRGCGARAAAAERGPRVHWLTLFQSRQSGEQFWKLKECYIRGSNVSGLAQSRA